MFKNAVCILVVSLVCMNVNTMPNWLSLCLCCCVSFKYKFFQNKPKKTTQPSTDTLENDTFNIMILSDEFTIPLDNDDLKPKKPQPHKRQLSATNPTIETDDEERQP